MADTMSLLLKEFGRMMDAATIDAMSLLLIKSAGRMVDSLLSRVLVESSRRIDDEDAQK